MAAKLDARDEPAHYITRMRLAATDLSLIMQVAMPRLGLHPPGYRRLKGTLQKRLSRRMAELGLQTAGDYLAHLDAQPGEWAAFDALCRMSISRFYRDGQLFEELRRRQLPLLVERAREAGRRRWRAWSAGCASGEEPFSLALLWWFGVRPAHPGMDLDVLATDADPHLLDRAESARYAAATLRELPDEWRHRGFDFDGSFFHLREPLRRMARFERRDLRDWTPEGSFDLVLCRNAAFTYLDASSQSCVARRIGSVLAPGGVLVLGAGEVLPESGAEWATRWGSVYVKQP